MEVIHGEAGVAPLLSTDVVNPWNEGGALIILVTEVQGRGQTLIALGGHCILQL
jgi:hypothetical protein